MKFRERVARFMQGRYGADQFSRFLSFAPLVLLVLSIALGSVANGIPGTVLWLLALALMIFGLYRMFSKNIYKRQEENAKYLHISGKFTGFFRNLWQRIKDMRQYKYFKCPSCKATLRVPRHKGKVQITCKKCGERFFGNT